MGRSAKLANFGLTVQDVQNALKDQNRESAAGVLGQQPIKRIGYYHSYHGSGPSFWLAVKMFARANADGSAYPYA